MPEENQTPQPDQQATGKATGTDQGSQPVTFPAWMAQLPDAFKKHAGLAKYKTVGELAKAHVELGESADELVRVPGEKATPEERAAFWRRLGQPESVQGYDMPEIQWPAELAAVGPKFLESIRVAAYKSNLTKEQAATLIKQIAEAQRDTTKQVIEMTQADRKKARDELDKTLREKWGDSYEVNALRAKRAFLSMAPASLIAWAKEVGADTRPDFIEGFARIGELMGEDSLIRTEEVASREVGAQRDTPAYLDEVYPSMKEMPNRQDF